MPNKKATVKVAFLYYPCASKTTKIDWLASA